MFCCNPCMHPVGTALRRGGATLVFLLLAATTSAPVQAQDPAKALGGFLQNLVRPGQGSPANSATQALGNLLGGTPAGQNNKPGDLVQLLTQSVEDIDESKEIEIGRQLAAILLGAKPLHPNMAVQRYVNQLGRWISLQSSRPRLPWTFGVLDDPGYNAFATPGGFIFVTKGLLDHVTDEAELAGILAHEITHVISKHHLQAIRKSARSGLLSQIAASQLRDDLAGGLSAQLLSMGRNLYARGLDQEDELEADRNGVALATRAGFDPYGLVAVLQQLRTEAPDNPLFTLSFSTHPSAQLRLDQVEQAMGQRLDAFAVPQAPVPIAQRLAGAATR